VKKGGREGMVDKRQRERRGVTVESEIELVLNFF